MAASDCKSKFASMKSFENVTDDKIIGIETFLTACTDISSILSDLGGAFAFPRKDLQGNIKKINERYKSNQEKYLTLNKILEEDATSKNMTSTVVSVIWLLRGLNFLHAFLSNLIQEFHDKDLEENLRPTLMKAYESSLRMYHGTIVQFAVCNTFRFSPGRTNVLQILATDPSVTKEMVISDMESYMINFTATLKLVQELLDIHDLKLS